MRVSDSERRRTRRRKEGGGRSGMHCAVKIRTPYSDMGKKNELCETSIDPQPTLPLQPGLIGR